MSDSNMDNPIHITVPLNLIPSNMKEDPNIQNDLRKIINTVLLDENFTMKTGKGYTFNGKPLHDQVDISLAGHVITTISVYLTLINAVEETGLRIDPKLFMKSVLGLVLHDSNKYVGRIGYSAISLDELEHIIRQFIKKSDITSINENEEDILDVICLIERVEQGSTGRYCKKLPIKLREDQAKVIIRLMRISDVFVSETSKIPVNEYKLIEKINDMLKELESQLLQVGINYKISFFKIKDTPYILTKYIILKAILGLIMEKEGKPLLISKNSIIYLKKNNSDDFSYEEIIDRFLYIFGNSLKTRKVRKRPNQSSIEYPQLEIISMSHDISDHLEVIKEFFSDENIQKDLMEFFEKYIWLRENGYEFSLDKIVTLIDTIDEENKWFAYMIIYIISNSYLRKKFFKEAISYDVSLPDSADPENSNSRTKILKKYEELYEKIFKNVFRNEWIKENQSKMIKILHTLLQSSFKNTYGLIRDSIKLHVENSMEFYNNHGGDAESNPYKMQCAICGRPNPEYHYKGIEFIPIKELVSNFYWNILKPGDTSTLKLCRYCYLELLLRKYMIEAKSPYYVIVSLSPYFPVIEIRGNIINPTYFSFGKGEKKIEINGILVNPVYILSENDSNNAMGYFVIVPKISSDISKGAWDSIKLIDNIMNWARFGFRVRLSKVISISELSVKPYVSLEGLNPNVTAYFGGSEFLFNDLHIIWKKIELIKILIEAINCKEKRKRGIKSNKVNDLVNSLSNNILSGFHFLLIFLSCKPLKRDSFLRGGLMLEELNKEKEGLLLNLLEELAHIYYEEYKYKIDLDSRNSRTWPIREAFDSYVKLHKYADDKLRDIIASTILKYSEQDITNKSNVLKFSENFSEIFVKLINELKKKHGYMPLNPSIRSYLIDIFDYYVIKNILSR